MSSHRKPLWLMQSLAGGDPHLANVITRVISAATEEEALSNYVLADDQGSIGALVAVCNCEYGYSGSEKELIKKLANAFDEVEPEDEEYQMLLKKHVDELVYFLSNQVHEKLFHIKEIKLDEWM